MLIALLPATLLSHSIAFPPAAQESGGATPPDALLERLEAEVPALLERHGEPGLALALVDGGRVQALRAFGLADRESERAVTPETLFNVGSLSKPVTAWAVLRLHEEDELDLDAPVLDELEDFTLPDSEYDPSGVTARRLLRHTAGLSMPSAAGYDLDGDIPSVREALTEELRLIHAPGERHEYSGGGYGLLQLLLEQRTGESFEVSMQALVLDPLGMEQSGPCYAPERPEDFATPYTTRFEEGRDASRHARWRHRRFPLAAAAGLYTSAAELGRFVAAHCEAAERPAGRGVLSPASVELLASTSEASPRYGLGLQVLPAAGEHAVLMHTGINHGWHAGVLFVPDLGMGIAVLTNSDGSETLRATLGIFRDAVLRRIEGDGR